MDRIELDRLAEQMRLHEKLVRQEEVERHRLALRIAYAGAMTKVCASMASQSAVLSILIEDPKEAAKSFGDSVKWQMAGFIAGFGEPKFVSEFLEKASE